MSPTRLGYKEFGHDLVSLEEKISYTPKRPLMEGENKDDGTRDPFKLFLEESLPQQMNEMMDRFAQILRRIPTSDESSLSGGDAPFKVHIKFDIPIFEGHIDADVANKWLNLLEGYFFVHNLLIEKILPFYFSNTFPISNISGRFFVRKRK